MSDCALSQSLWWTGSEPLSVFVVPFVRVPTRPRKSFSSALLTEGPCLDYAVQEFRDRVWGLTHKVCVLLLRSVHHRDAGALFLEPQSFEDDTAKSVETKYLTSATQQLFCVFLFQPHYCEHFSRRQIKKTMKKYKDFEPAKFSGIVDGNSLTYVQEHIKS